MAMKMRHELSSLQREVALNYVEIAFLVTRSYRQFKTLSFTCLIIGYYNTI